MERGEVNNELRASKIYETIEALLDSSELQREQFQELKSRKLTDAELVLAGEVYTRRGLCVPESITFYHQYNYPDMTESGDVAAGSEAMMIITDDGQVMTIYDFFAVEQGRIEYDKAIQPSEKIPTKPITKKDAERAYINMMSDPGLDKISAILDIETATGTKATIDETDQELSALRELMDALLRQS